MLHLTLQAKVRFGFAGALLLLIVSGFLSQRGLQTSMKDAAWVTHTEEVLGQVIGVAGALQAAESDERGFLLTGDQKLRDRFGAAEQQTIAHLAHLRTLTADNPQEQQRLARLEPLLREVMAEEASEISQQGSDKRPSPAQTFGSAGSKQAMQQIRTLFQQIGGEEAKLLRRRTIDARLSSGTARVVVAVGGILGALGVFLCALLVTRYLRQREQAEAALLQVQQGLEERVKERTSELAGLAESLKAEIGERRKAEGHLRQSELRYRLVARAANGAIWDWDLSSNKVDWNEDAQTLFGYSAGQIGETWWRDRLHPEDRDRVVASVDAAIKSTEEHWSDEYRYRRGDGSYADVLDRGYVVRDQGGKALRMIGSMLDLSEHRRAERALQDSERRYQMLFEDSPLPMVVFDAESLAFLAVNAAAEELYGYTREEFLKMTLRDTRPPDQVPVLLDFLKTVETADAYRNAFTCRRKDGQPLMIEASVRTIQFGGRKARLQLLTDVTEQKRLESQLLQSQKMEAVGRLAGGIAHDFNNLLTVILGYSEFILESLDENDPLRSKVSEIQTAGQRAANLTRQLLAFSRKQILQLQTLELNAVVSNISKLLGRILGEDVRIMLHLDGDLGQIQADPTQLEQVLVNLAVNARDAMPKGGQLIIETRNIQVDEPAAAVHGVPQGDYVLLVISDTGCGMDEATKAKIFEPFFTTKEVGKGTGLGLSMVLGFVQQSGGTVTVYSERAIGTTFRIYLPRFDAPPTQITQPEKMKALPAGKETTILLVEDEDMLRTLARAVLQDAGYKVLEANNGKKALDILEGSPHLPALVVTDVVMPEMSGPDLAEHLRKKWPELPILFTSGYSDHALLERTALRPDTAFLQKPYMPRDLLEHVAAELEGSRPAVLIADDDTNIRQLLRTIFEEAGYSVIEVSDGKALLDQIARRRIKLVVTDLIMPGKEGMETIQALRQNYPDVKIVAISGALGGAYLKMANRLGADAVVSKPFRREEVLEAVEAIF